MKAKLIELLNNTYLGLYIDYAKWQIRNLYLSHRDPKKVANATYKNVMGTDIDWNHPHSLIEKIYWLQLFSDTSLWTTCADKYEVRNYISEKGYENLLNELYGCWNNVSEMDWDALPNSFVLKPNNGCGQVIIVKNKDEINKKLIKKQLSLWLKIKYGFVGGQYHYTRIKPCIIAEKLLINEDAPDKSLVDYKIWCFDGKPDFVLIVYNRDKNGYLLSVYDMEWNNISDKVLNKDNPHFSNKSIPKPHSFDKMVEAAASLSKRFPQVRVDFYDVGGNAIFGEMTFST